MADIDNTVSKLKEGFDEVKDNVIDETKEVIQEAQATVRGETLESANTVGGAGYREAPTKEGQGLAVAALVLGILSIIMAFVAWYIGLIIGIIGVIIGASARKKNQTSMATAGFVCSIIGLCLSAVMLVCAAACIGGLASLANS